MCQNSVTTPLRCHVYQKKIAFRHTPSAHTPFNTTQSLRAVVQHWTPETVHTVSNVHQNIAIKGLFYVPQNARKCIYSHLIFQKFFGGACPRTPLAGLGLRPGFCCLYAS